jgi:hypothetical protein
MENSAPLFWSIILISSMLLPAASVFVVWKLVSRSTPPAKRPSSPPPTPPSDSHLARVEADQAELFSTLAKINTTVKRLSSRAGMADLREQRAAPAAREEPPKGTSKAELFRHYGLSGKVGPAFAQAQLALEADMKINDHGRPN